MPFGPSQKVATVDRVLTLHLDAVDISRTVVRSTPSVMTELEAAATRLVHPSPTNHLTAWTANTRAALRPVMRPYLDLCRVPKWRPDFLGPITNGTDFEAELEQVVATPAAVLRAELQPRIDSGDLPARTRDLAAGDLEAVRRLRAAMVAFHEIAVVPYWAEIVAAVHADRAARGSTLVDEGIDRLLNTLSPHLLWRSSKLSYECPGGADVDLAPGGRGVILVPSYLQPVPSFQNLAGEPVVISYPIQRPQRELTTGKPLADLLGRTRAAVLSAIDGGRSTTQVAHNVGISAGSASQHASVLRSAGLITTHRAGQAVLHSLTPLGETLLETTR